MGHPNIFTKDIAKYLSVPMDVAEKIQDVIDIYFSLDWSEADEVELQATYIWRGRWVGVVMRVYPGG